MGGVAQLIGSTPGRHQALAVPQQTYWVCWCVPEKSEEEGMKREGRGRRTGQGIFKGKFTFESFVHSHGVAHLLFLRARGSSETR